MFTATQAGISIRFMIQNRYSLATTRTAFIHCSRRGICAGATFLPGVISVTGSGLLLVPRSICLSCWQPFSPQMFGSGSLIRKNEKKFSKLLTCAILYPAFRMGARPPRPPRNTSRVHMSVHQIMLFRRVVALLRRLHPAHPIDRSSVNRSPSWVVVVPCAGCSCAP